MKLKEYLKTTRIKAVELANDAGVTVNVVYSIIRGNNVSLKHAFAISKATKGKVPLKDMEPIDLTIRKDKNDNQNDEPNKEAYKTEHET